ncbi:hypothetical protein DH2020_038556 [Rehmannia glutinosa]|uniref:Protein kinase domain-containing protein n=1 Tax=Rehmannia glutinosa TaxID=99300 RepID=A0ABR0UYP4_REHGL
MLTSNFVDVIDHRFPLSLLFNLDYCLGYRESRRFLVDASMGLFSDFCGCLRRRLRGTDDGASTTGDDAEDSSNLFFKLEALQIATNFFSELNQLGHGGFGPVYKGLMSNGQEVAVKKLSLNSRQGLKEFANEVKLLLRVQHKNLVMLLGCCVEGPEKMLVYSIYRTGALTTFFSFRILLLEIVSGRKNHDRLLGAEKADLLNYAWSLFQDGKSVELVDSSLDKYIPDEAIICVQLGLLCCQASVADRPDMNSVHLMLSSDSFTLPKPGKPGIHGEEANGLPPLLRLLLTIIPTVVAVAQPKPMVVPRLHQLAFSLRITLEIQCLIPPLMKLYSAFKILQESEVEDPFLFLFLFLLGFVERTFR